MKKKIILLFIIFIVASLFITNFAWGAICRNNTDLDCQGKNINDNCIKTGDSSGAPAFCLADANKACTCTISSLSGTATTISLENPIGGQKDAGLFTPLIRIIENAMGIMGAIALAAFVYGGFNWLISAGSAEKVKTGTTTMVWAAIGLFIIFSSYAILKLITDALGGL